MKKSVCACVILLLLVACNSEMRRIELAANDYLMAVSLYDLDGAESYCTEETSKTTLVIGRYLMAYTDSSFFEQDKPVTIDITDVRCTTDTTATVHFHKVTPIKDITDSLEMRKRDGKWLAHAPIIKNKAVAQ